MKSDKKVFIVLIVCLMLLTVVVLNVSATQTTISEDVPSGSNTSDLGSAGKLHVWTAPNGDVFVYDEALNTWTNTGDLAAATDVYSLAEFNSKLYAWTAPNGDVFIYDEGANTWTNTGDLAAATDVYSLAELAGAIDIYSIAVFMGILMAMLFLIRFISRYLI